jgi:hypothetical protein
MDQIAVRSNGGSDPSPLGSSKNADLATDFGVGAKSQIATGPFWRG